MQDRLVRGRPPTVREVQTALGFRAVESAREHLEALVTEGRLTKTSGRSRGYGLPALEGAATTLVPLLGRVQAGALTTAVEDLEGYMPIESRGSEAPLFALRVRGESMTGAGILPGDLVIVRQQSSAETGDIVVALVDDEATVKRLRRLRNRIELLAENPAFQPIVLQTDEARILGKVIEVRRYLDKSGSPSRTKTSI